MSEKNPYILAAESVGSKPKATSNPYEEEAKFRASFEGAKAETARLALKGKANPNLIPAALRQKQLPTIADALPASSARSALELAARVSPEARRAITVHPKDPWADFGFTREDLQRSIDLNLPHVRLKGSDQYISLDAAQRQVQKRFGKPVRFEGSKPPEQVEQEFYERGNENIETPSERGRRRFLEKKKEGSNQLHNIINEHPIFLLAKGVKALATDVPNAYIAAAMSVPGSRLPATSKLTEAELASAVHERAKTSPGAVMFQYLMPGIGQAHLLGDVTGTVGSAIEKESTKPIQDFGKQMVQGTAFWEPGIGFEERIVRMLNAAMLGHGFAKAVQHPLAYKARQAAAGRIAEGIERFWSKAKEGGANEAIAEGSKSLKIAPELLKKSIEAESQPPRKADSVPAPQSPKPEPIVTKPRQTQFSSEGHTFEESRIPPQEIGVMPGLQYKKVGVVDPANAVTDELKGVKKYDQATAGPLTVWETMDGKRWVMNGHHRRELAIRTGEADVPVRVFRESDGIDFKTARALGALQNMRDGKGTAIDAATVLRDLGAPMEKLKEYGLNTRSGVARDAISLLQLDPDSLRLVEEGSVPESVAAGIADAGLDPKRQAAVMRLAAASDLETRNQGAFLGERAKSAPMVDRTGGSGDLFGEIEESLALVEQAKIADAAMKRLAQSQRALSAFNRAKSVGKTFIDSDAQSSAAAIQEFGRKVIGTDPEAARVLETEATNYAKNPTKAQLSRSVDAVVAAAESAAERRLGELQPNRLGQDTGDRSGDRNGGSETLIDVDPELELKPSPDKQVKRTAPKPDSNPVGKQLELDPENIGDAKGQFGLGLDSPRSHDVTKGSQRIPWAEEPGGFTGQISDLVLDLGKIADRKILQGKRKKEGAAGTYYPGTTQTVIRRWNDLDTAAHEAAHALDDKFGIVADWATSEKPSPFDKELQWFWERGGSGGPDKSWTYNRAEGVAEFIRSYMVNPKAALERAPAFAKHFKSVLPEEVLSQIENVSLRLRQWHGSTAIEKTRAAIRTDKTPSPGIAERTKDFFDPNRIGEDFKTSGLDKARVLFTDEMAPFVTAAKQAAKRRGMDLDRLRPSNSPVILARGLTYFPQRFEAVIEFGMTDKSGKVVSPPANFLLRSLDRSTAASLKADVKDLEALLVSERTFEKADQIAEAGMLQLGEIEHRLNDRVQQRLESIEGSLRRNFELVYQRELGRLEAKAKARRAEGKSLPADAHNRHNKRIQSNLDKQKERIRLRHEEEIQRQLDIARQRELEMVRARMELAARAIEKRVMLDQSRLTGAGGGIHSATDIAAQSIQALQRDPRRYARLSVAAAAYRQWSDAVLQYMVQKGRLSGEAYAQIKSRNQQYAAMQRFLDDAEHIDMGNRGGMAGAKEVIKEFTGSTATIDSPLANLLKNTFAAMKEADRNEVMAAFTKLLSTDRGMYQGKPMNLAAIGQQVSEGTAGAVRVFIRGKPQYWLFEEGIDKAIRGMGRVSVPNWIGKTAQFLTNALRKGVTVMPGFQVRNRIRDTEQTLLVSPHQFKPSDWLKRASKEERRLYEFFGGGIGRGHYLDGAVDFFDVRDRLITEMRLDRRSVVLDPRRLAESYGEALRRSEMAPRMAEIRAAEREAFKNLKSEYDRQLYKHNSARNLIDFAQGGTITKFVSRFMTPFTNAQVQGQRSLLNMAADHPSKFAVRWLATTLIPHIAVYAWNRAAGDKNLDEYRQLPAYQRDMFYNLKVGDNIWLKIPKNFEAGVVGASLERSIDAMYGNGEAFEGYGGSLAKSFLPFDEGSIQGYGLSPISEAITNRDSFRDKPIVPQHEDALALELREYDKEASRFGVLFQQALGIDARKIDHLVRGFFGEAGQFALFASDLGRDDKPMRKHVALNRAFGVTAGSPGMSSPIVNEVMEMSRQSGSRENPLGELVDEYFDARTDQEADDAADALRTAARALKVQYETAAKGKTGEFRFLAIQRVLAKSPYRRKRDLHRKLPGLKVGESGDILGLPGGGPSDPLGLR